MIIDVIWASGELKFVELGIDELSIFPQTKEGWEIGRGADQRDGKRESEKSNS